MTNDKKNIDLKTLEDLLAGAPRWSVDSASGRVLGGNAAAAILFGAGEVARLEGAGEPRLRRQLAAVAGRDAPGIERIRVYQGMRDLVLTCMRSPDAARGTTDFQAVDTGLMRMAPLPARLAALGADALAGAQLLDADGRSVDGGPVTPALASAAAALAASGDGRAETGFALEKLLIDGNAYVIAREERTPQTPAAGEKPSEPTPAEPEIATPEEDPLSQARYRLLIDRDGIVIEADAALSALLGYEGDDICGTDLVTDTECRDDALEKAVAAGVAFRDVPAVWTGPAGHRGFLLAGAPVYDENLDHVGYRTLATGGVEIADDTTDEDDAPAVATQTSPEAPVADADDLGGQDLDDEDFDDDLIFADDPRAPGTVLPFSRGGDGTESAGQPKLTENEAQAFKAIRAALGPADELGYREITPSANDTETNADDTQRDSAPEEAAEDTAPHAAKPAAADDTSKDETGEASGHALSGSVLDEISEAVIVLRGDEILHANRAALDLFGYADTGAIEEEGGVGALFTESPADMWTGERRVDGVRSDGSPFPVDARLKRISWDGEPAMGYFLKSLPVSEPEPEPEPRPAIAEMDSAELRAEIDELRTILDTATEGVVVLDAEGRIERLNQSAEALFGHDSASVRGRPFSVLIAADSRESAEDYLEGLRRNGVASLLNDGREITGQVAQGGPVPLFLTVGRLGDGENAKFCAVIRDITQWKKAESDLIEARRRAETVSSQKSDFLAKISHEIRTPLNAIIGFSEVMIEERFGPIGNERYRGYMQDIRASGEHVLSLVNDLLDLSKIEAGRADLEFGSVAINDSVQQAVAIMQPEANRERIIIRTNITQELPPVVADSRSLRQILLNLLSNAIKFTPPGGQIIVSTMHTASGEVVLRVRDTGIGMSDADIRTAMEPFRQVAALRGPDRKGTGLGLPLTKALVEANRANFHIESKVDHGTLVEISFPQNRVLAE
ncbi:MAG: PAS domain S-box protein [Flavobacteriaceae bacterium]